MDDSNIVRLILSSGLHFDTPPGKDIHGDEKIHGTFSALKSFSTMVEEECQRGIRSLGDFIPASTLPTREDGHTIEGVTTKVAIHAFSAECGIMLRIYSLKHKSWDNVEEFGEVLFWAKT